MLFFCRVTEFNYIFIQKNNSSPKGTDLKKKKELAFAIAVPRICYAYFLTQLAAMA